jgi:hypothetical protein
LFRKSVDISEDNFWVWPPKPDPPGSGEKWSKLEQIQIMV